MILFLLSIGRVPVTATVLAVHLWHTSVVKGSWGGLLLHVSLLKEILQSERLHVKFPTNFLHMFSSVIISFKGSSMLVANECYAS